MAGGKLWSGKDINLLFWYAERCSQRVAADRLGRSLLSVKSKVKDLQIKWRKGFIGLNQIARECGCSLVTAVKVAEALLWSERRSFGRGTGKRYYLTYEQADRVRAVLSRRIALHKQHQEAGRIRHMKGGMDGTRTN